MWSQLLSGYNVNKDVVIRMNMYIVLIEWYYFKSAFSSCNVLSNQCGIKIFEIIIISGLSIRAGNWPKQLATGQFFGYLLSSHLTITFDLEPKKKNEKLPQNYHNVWVEVKMYFKSFNTFSFLTRDGSI